MQWYLGVWKKYAVFGGRARRKEYWFFALFHVIASICLILTDNVIGTYDPYIEFIGFGLLSGIYALAIFDSQRDCIGTSSARYRTQRLVAVNCVNPSDRSHRVIGIPVHRQQSGRKPIWCEPKARNGGGIER